MPPPIIVQYQATPEVLTKAVSELRRSLGGTSLRVSVAILWIGLLFLGRFVLSETVMKQAEKPAQLAVAALGSTIVALLIWRNSVRKKAGDPVTIQEMNFRFSEIGVEKQTNATESRIDWQAFAEYRESKGYVFLCYPKTHPGAITLAEVLPKAAFQSPEELNSFRKLLEAKLKPGKEAPRTRPIFWVAAGFIVLLMVTVSMAIPVIEEMQTAEITVAEYFQLKKEGRIWEVWIADDGKLKARLTEIVTRNGKVYRKVRSRVSPDKLDDDEYFNKLVEGIPERRVHTGPAR